MRVKKEYTCNGVTSKHGATIGQKSDEYYREEAVTRKTAELEDT